jgi:hypothetical protein
MMGILGSEYVTTNLTWNECINEYYSIFLSSFLSLFSSRCLHWNGLPYYKAISILSSHKHSSSICVHASVLYMFPHLRFPPCYLLLQWLFKLSLFMSSQRECYVTHAKHVYVTESLISPTFLEVFLLQSCLMSCFSCCHFFFILTFYICNKLIYHLSNLFPLYTLCPPTA